MQKTSTTIGLIQMKMEAAPEKNLAKAVKKITEAAKRGAKIICLPELFNTLYFPQEKCDKAAFDLAEDATKGKTVTALQPLARKLKVVIIAPFYEKAGKKFFNTAVVIDADGKLLNPYRKIHIPQDPHFWEKNYFAEGDKGYQVYKTRYGNFSVLICFDQWYPEAARIVTLAGAEIIFYPTAIGYLRGYKSKDGEWADAWETVMRGHAIASGTHIAAINRVGIENRMQFWGRSFVSDSFGKILKRGSSSEEIIVQKVNLAHNKRIREGWGFLRNRRPETYNSLTKPVAKR